MNLAGGAIVTATLLLIAAAPGSSSTSPDAASVVVSGDHVFYEGGRASNELVILSDKDNEVRFIERNESVDVHAGRGCVTHSRPNGATAISCSGESPEGHTTVGAVEIRLAGGADRVVGSCLPTPHARSVHINGGFGADVITPPGLGGLIVETGEGRDRVETCRGSDTVRGGPGRDSLDGGDGGDGVVGNGGPDLIHGRRGSDSVRGGGSSDRVSGDSGSDIVSGRGSSDLLLGGDGQDRLNGNEGTDQIRCGDDRDRFNIDALDEIDGSCEKGITWWGADQ